MKYFLLILSFLFSFLVLAERDQELAKYKKGTRTLNEAISIYKLFYKGKEKFPTFKKWINGAFKPHQIYTECNDSNYLKFSKCLNTKIIKNKNIEDKEHAIKLSKQFYCHREAKDILDSCFKQTGSNEWMPITCIKEASLTKNCPECTIYLAKKVFSLYSCGHHITPKDITACEKEYAVVDNSELKNLEMATNKKVPEVKLGVSQLPYNGLSVPLYGGFGAFGMFCSDPNSEGKITCNGILYKPDTSTTDHGRKIIEIVEKNTSSNYDEVQKKKSGKK